DGVIRSARVACGGVGTMPWRMRGCETALTGRPVDRDVFEEATSLSTLGAKALHHNHVKIALLPRTIVRALEIAGELA
ncbi:xanthine dehydrogenase family protein subunit M, partial [Mesorhizobium sp. M2A.F.Ca.ET.046.02.1.1]